MFSITWRQWSVKKVKHALGIPGQVTHERVRAAMRAVGEVAARHGVALGAYANTVDHAGLWLQEGVRYLACGVDQNILLRAVQDIRRRIDEKRS